MRNFGLMLARRLQKDVLGRIGGAQTAEYLYWRPGAHDEQANMAWHAQCSAARPDLWPEAGFRARLAARLTRGEI